MDCTMTGLPVHHQLPEFYSYLCPLRWWSHPTISFSVVPFSSCLQSSPASDFYNKSVLPIRWPKYWSVSFSICPSNECSGLISFGTDWLDLLAVQEILKSLLQHHSWKHQLFGAQLSLWSSSHLSTWPLEKPWLWRYGSSSPTLSLHFLIYCVVWS